MTWGVFLRSGGGSSASEAHHKKPPATGSLDNTCSSTIGLTLTTHPRCTDRRYEHILWSKYDQKARKNTKFAQIRTFPEQGTHSISTLLSPRISSCIKNFLIHHKFVEPRQPQHSDLRSILDFLPFCLFTPRFHLAHHIPSNTITTFRYLSHQSVLSIPIQKHWNYAYFFYTTTNNKTLQQQH